MAMQGRIVINPATLSDERDALAIAYNEAYRAVMEANNFEPKAQPTPEQEAFFADTAYADDPLMMRRTITARIATYDASVPNPTPEQYQDTIDMLRMVQSAGVISNRQEEEIVGSTLADMEAQLQNSPLVPNGAPPEMVGGMPPEVASETPPLEAATPEMMGEVGPLGAAAPEMEGGMVPLEATDPRMTRSATVAMGVEDEIDAQSIARNMFREEVETLRTEIAEKSPGLAAGMERLAKIKSGELDQYGNPPWTVRQPTGKRYEILPTREFETKLVPYAANQRNSGLGDPSYRPPAFGGGRAVSSRHISDAEAQRIADGLQQQADARSARTSLRGYTDSLKLYSDEGKKVRTSTDARATELAGTLSAESAEQLRGLVANDNPFYNSAMRDRVNVARLALKKWDAKKGAEVKQAGSDAMTDAQVTRESETLAEAAPTLQTTQEQSSTDTALLTDAITQSVMKDIAEGGNGTGAIGGFDVDQDTKLQDVIDQIDGQQKALSTAAPAKKKPDRFALNRVVGDMLYAPHAFTSSNGIPDSRLKDLADRGRVPSLDRRALDKTNTDFVRQGLDRLFRYTWAFGQRGLDIERRMTRLMFGNNTPTSADGWSREYENLAKDIGSHYDSLSQEDQKSLVKLIYAGDLLRNHGALYDHGTTPSLNLLAPLRRLADQNKWYELLNN